MTGITQTIDSFPQGFMGISRDWRQGLVEFASTGVMESGQWAVLQGRTASGKAMERTDEPMIVEALTVFGSSSREASAFSYEAGYR